MALKKDALRATVAEDSRDLAKTAAGKGRMRTYQIKFPEAVMEQFRVYCEGKGLSLSSGTRLAVMQYMEREGLR
ncbi:MAG: hypothetical protein WB384_27455 [Candidatus Sulfotelmatobacter sp.]|jgi:hypothetical protein